MNPARSLAPAIVRGHTEHLRVYLLAPPLGALAGVVIGGGLQLSRPPEPDHSRT
jgi:glycerol uptake facilitator-like aquaporin